jgi:hypothetical protein
VIRWAAALFVVMAFAGWLGAGTTAARADATIVSATIENGYPKNLTFKLTAHGTTDITDVTLAYAITGRGTSALGKPSDLSPGKDLSTSVTVQTNSGSSYIPVGSDFVYHWEITTSDGGKTVGPDTKFLYLPTGQDWKSVSGDFMTVYYHGSNASLANSYLTAGVETFDKIAVKLLKTTLKQVPVKVILFNDEKEADAARPGKGTTFDATTTTCGTKVTNDIVLVIPQSCGTPDRTDTLRHEFGHILNQTAGEGALGKLPSWLDEGTAVYAQLTPGDNFTGAYTAAARSGRLLPFASMGIAPNDPNLVNLFYGQAYTMVRYLIDKGGPEKYAQFFATIKAGSRFDEALNKTYGFDLAGFEKEFAGAAGSAPRPQPTAAPTQRPQQTSPTRAPATAPAVAKPVASSGGGVDRTSLVIIGGSVAMLLLGLLALLIAMMMANNRRRAQVAAQGAPTVEEWNPPPDTTDPPPGNDGMV